MFDVLLRADDVGGGDCGWVDLNDFGVLVLMMRPPPLPPPPFHWFWMDGRQLARPENLSGARACSASADADGRMDGWVGIWEHGETKNRELVVVWSVQMSCF